MKLSKNPSQAEVNNIKSYIMNSFRYCKRLSEGIETTEQFEAFTNICQIHVNNCNFWCNKLKPRLGFIHRDKKRLYNSLYNTCDYTVDSLSNIISIYNESFEKAKETAEMQLQLEMGARINSEVAIEYRDKELQKLKEARKPIGFKINYDNNDTTENCGK